MVKRAEPPGAPATGCGGFYDLPGGEGGQAPWPAAEGHSFERSGVSPGIAELKQLPVLPTVHRDRTIAWRTRAHEHGRCQKSALALRASAYPAWTGGGRCSYLLEVPNRLHCHADASRRGTSAIRALVQSAGIRVRECIAQHEKEKRERERWKGLDIPQAKKEGR